MGQQRVIEKDNKRESLRVARGRGQLVNEGSSWLEVKVNKFDVEGNFVAEVTGYLKMHGPGGVHQHRISMYCVHLYRDYR